MSVSVHCCEGMNISKLFCNWCQPPKKKKATDLEQVLYTDSIKQIVILSTPQIDCPELLLYEDLKDTDIVIFSLDEENQIRFASVQGSHLLKALTSTFSTLPSTTTTNNNLPPKITSNKDIAGHTLEEILPDYITRFLHPIYRQTLQGNYLQLTTMWMRTTQLVRTFPILNHKKEVIAGIAITSPFNPDFNGDINKFSLNRPEEKKKKHTTNNNPDHGPAPQSMEEKKFPTKSQNTPRSIANTPQHHRKLTDPSPRKRPVSVDTSIPLFDQGGPVQVVVATQDLVPNSTEENNTNEATDTEAETTVEAENSINNKSD